MQRDLASSTTSPTTELRVRMPIEAFGLIRARAALARATSEVESWEAEAFHNEARASAHLAFLQILGYSEQMTALEAELAAHAQRVKLVEQRLVSGLTTTDIHAEAVGDQLSAQRESLRVQASLMQSRARLQSWTRLEVLDETQLVSPAARELAAGDLGELDNYLQHVEYHPQLRVSQALVRASEAKRREEAREALPSIRYLQADGAFEGGAAPEISAMVGVEVPLFAGARADISMAEVDTSKAQARFERATHQRNQQITGQWHAAGALQQLWRDAQAHAEGLEKTLASMSASGDPVAVSDLRVRATRAHRRATEDLTRYLEAKLALDYSAANLR